MWKYKRRSLTWFVLLLELCPCSVGHSLTGCKKMLKTRKLSLLLVLIVACCQSWAAEALRKSRKTSVYDGLQDFGYGDLDESSLRKLEHYLKMRDVEKRLERLKLKNFIQNLDDGTLDPKDPFSVDQDGYQGEADRDDDDDYEIDDSEFSNEAVKKLRGSLEKRGRWQGFCFRRTRSGRRLPYICWRDSH